MMASQIRFLINVLRKYALGISLSVVVCALGSALLTPFSTFSMQRLLESLPQAALNRGITGDCIVWMALLCASFLIAGLCDYGQKLLRIGLERRLYGGFLDEVGEKFCKLPLEAFEVPGQADTIKRMGKRPQEAILELFYQTLEVISLALSVLGTAFLFAQVEIWLAALFLCLFVPMFWLDFRSITYMNQVFVGQSKKQRRADYFESLLRDKNALLELKLYRTIPHVLHRCRHWYREVQKERMGKTLLSQRYFAGSLLLEICWALLAIGTMGKGLVAGKVSAGMFIALTGSLGTLLAQSNALSRALSGIGRAYSATEACRMFLEMPDRRRGSRRVAGEKYRITFEDVWFRYPGTERDILRGLSFCIEPGEHVALVGSNGAGKSTLIKLLCGLYLPDRGRILVNGQDIRHMDDKWLRRVYSVVFQDYGRYMLSLRENVGLQDVENMGRDDRIEGALRAAGAETLLGLPGMELDRPLGRIQEGGRELSGGQWQKLALARGLMPNSGFVILDEPTAALDPLAESRLYEEFSMALRTRGCILVSHRLGSTKLANRIIVLEEGKVVQEGSHRALMEAGGPYARMFTAQAAWYKEGGNQ